MIEQPEATTAIRDAAWHLAEASRCMREAVKCDPRLVTKLGSPHAQLQDLREQLQERTNGTEGSVGPWSRSSPAGNSDPGYSPFSGSPGDEIP